MGSWCGQGQFCCWLESRAPGQPCNFKLTVHSVHSVQCSAVITVTPIHLHYNIKLHCLVYRLSLRRGRYFLTCNENGEMGTSNSVYIPDKDNLSIISFLVPPSVLIVSVGKIVHPVHGFGMYARASQLCSRKWMFESGSVQFYFSWSGNGFTC